MNVVNPGMRRMPGTDGDAAKDAARFAKKEFLAQCHRRARVVAEGTELVIEGETFGSVVWVLSGWLALSKRLDDGRVMIVDVALPVDLVHVQSADGRTAAFGVTAISDCVVACFSRTEMSRQQDSLPGLGQIVARLGWAASARQYERLLRIGQGNAKERVAFLLLEIAARMQQGRAIQDANSYGPIPLSQRQIGEMTGMTNVHVCRTIGQLADRRLVEMRDGRLILRDMAGLGVIARTDVDDLRRAILC